MSDERSHIITGLETQKRNARRVNVHVDGTYSFSLSLDEAAKLHKGQALSDADIAELQGDDEVERAVDRALRFLSVRPRSEHEVRQSLRLKEVPPPVIDRALERLRALGYVDDRAFAEFWASDRRQFKPLSARALRYELRQKGVSAEIIDEVLREQDDSEEAYRAAKSQVRRVKTADRRELHQKLMMFLARRGFPPRVSRDAVARLLEELDEEGKLASISAEDDVVENFEGEP
ncbi:MAG: RecX family transcriptional regulator [Anaerolineae bacterium]